MKTRYATLLMILAASCFAQVTVSYNQYGMIEIDNGSATLGVVAVKLFDATSNEHWYIKQDNTNLLAPNSHSAWPAYDNDSTTVAAVLYSDGTHTGDIDVVSLKALRDRVQVGNFDLQGWPIAFGKFFDSTNAGTFSDSTINPNASVHAYFLKSTYHVYGWTNNILTPNYKDGYGLDMVRLTWWGDGNLLANGFAGCPQPNPVVLNRVTINATARTQDSCPLGTPGSFASHIANLNAMYGPNGLGGASNETFGLYASSTMSFGGRTYTGSMQDSCEYIQPKIISGGGVGNCY